MESVEAVAYANAVLGSAKGSKLLLELLDLFAEDEPTSLHDPTVSVIKLKAEFLVCRTNIKERYDRG